MSRTYNDAVKALILDWSGTTVDAYVIAPAIAFVEAFGKHGIEISVQEARGPMGLRKDLHIEALTQMPEIRNRWRNVHRADPTRDDLARLYNDFVSIQLNCLKEYATLLPGVAQTTRTMQTEGIKIGTTTGFVRSMVDILKIEAHRQGYVPDTTVAGDDVANGTRPKPFMIYRNMELLDISPIESVVKVDDTSSGIEEGLVAGCWTVGIARYSNYMDVNSLSQADSMPAYQIERRLAAAREKLSRAGAHYVVNEFSELLDVVGDINRRLASGDNP